MDDTYSAQVIAFPRRSAGRAISDAIAPDDDAGERLQRALQALEHAVLAQRAVVAQWRGALGALGSNVSVLHVTMQGYDAKLGELRGRVDAVTANAQLLDAWADAAVAVAGKMAQEK